MVTQGLTHFLLESVNHSYHTSLVTNTSLMTHLWHLLPPEELSNTKQSIPDFSNIPTIMLKKRTTNPMFNAGTIIGKLCLPSFPFLAFPSIHPSMTNLRRRPNFDGKTATYRVSHRN